MNDVSMIVGVFKDYAGAEEANRRLLDSGISPDSIQIRSELKTHAVGHTEEPEQGGGFSGWVRRIFGGGMPGEHEDQYTTLLRNGGALVCVTADGNNLDRAVDILESAGAVDIDEEGTGAAVQGAVPSAATATRPRPSQEDDTRSIPVVEEQLKVGKRAVRRGGVRVYSRTVEEPVEQDITLREERVLVQRRPANRPASAADDSSATGETVEIVETVEEPVVSKESRVKEDVVIGKQTTERKEKIRDKVKHTDVKVEPVGDSDPEKA